MNWGGKAEKSRVWELHEICWALVLTVEIERRKNEKDNTILERRKKISCKREMLTIVRSLVEGSIP